MALRDITDPDAVRTAIREFDELGREAFLHRYGFGPSREYVLISDGREYDSKAILGAAHGHQHPELGPLPSGDFNGGDQTVAALRRLGFDVRALSRGGESTSELLAAFLDRYGTAKSEPFQGGHEAATLLKQAAASLSDTLPPALAGAQIKPSVGQGNWAAVPWIAVLDPRITTSTQHGVYPVILFREDLSALYVTIAQGVTDLKRERGQRGAYEVLRERAAALRPSIESLSSRGFSLDSDIDLGRSQLGRDYAASTIAYKRFAREELAGSTVNDDIAAVNAAYGTLVDAGALETSAPHSLPSAAPQVLCVYVGEAARANFESGGRRGWWGWKNAPPDEVGLIRVGDLIAFGSGFSGGSPRVELATWQQHAVRSVVVGRVDRVPFRTDEAVMPDELSGERQYPWKIRFTILGEATDIALSGDSELSTAAADALRRSAIAQGRGVVAAVADSPLLERYLDVTDDPRVATTPAELRELADQFVSRVDASGLKVDPRQLTAFLAGALAKPFVILTGQSGSGKTQLAKRLGEWCGEDAHDRPRYLVVPVRPDWTGPEFLFGYADGLAERIDGRSVWAVPETLEFILRANSDPGAPYVLVLDEMNLAHVERYFADFLSGVESREPVIPNLAQQDGVWVEREHGGRLPLPPNLVAIGTVNVDETTYTFSPKVLDRSFVHEFRVTSDDLDPALRRPVALDAADGETHRRFVRLLQDDVWHLEHPHPHQDELVEELRSLHDQLEPIGHDFGHRVFLEALRFAALASAVGFDSVDETIDFIVMTKLLPKIHGSRQRLDSGLRNLQTWAQGSDRPPEDPRCPRTFAKLDRMITVLTEAQFVTFTE